MLFHMQSYHQTLTYGKKHLHVKDSSDYHISIFLILLYALSIFHVVYHSRFSEFTYHKNKALENIMHDLKVVVWDDLSTNTENPQCYWVGREWKKEFCHYLRSIATDIHLFGLHIILRKPKNILPSVKRPRYELCVTVLRGRDDSSRRR